MRKGYCFLAAALLMAGCAKETIKVSAVQETDATGLRTEEALPAPPGGPVSVRAGFFDDPETRSRIEVDGSAAKVLWTRGDSFQAIYSSFTGGYYLATFTTEDDGVTDATFTTYSGLNDGSDFHCFYPQKGKWTIYNGGILFGFNLPSVQNAVAGGIEEGLNRAYAHTDEFGRPDPIRFYNLPSLLRFRMDGAVVSSIKEITLSGPGALSGDLVFQLADGIPVEYHGISFTGDEQFSKITLQGDFEPGVDYFIALWPRQMSWFRMEFSDGQGKSTLKQSSKAVTFERSRIKDFGTIHLGDEFAEVDDGSLDPVKYMSATEGSKPVTIAVIPEGFTKEELPKYELLAKSGINALFDTEPYKTYRNRFNVYILKVASHESGASITDGNGNVTTPVASYFGARWGENYYGDMAAESTSVFEFVSEKCPDIVDGIHMVDEVPILMIINDSRYGGICWSYSNGRGYAMIPYTFEGGGIQWHYPEIVPTTDDPLPTPVDESVLNGYYRATTSSDLSEIGGKNAGDWRNTLVHEFGGHCFGRLGDEYWHDDRLNYTANPVDGHTWAVPFSLNLASNPAAAPWKTELLDRREDLVSVDARYGRIGTFQGGGNYLYGRWRSEKISCMIDNRFYFSAWQRYLITQRIFTLSGDPDKFSFENWFAKDVTLDPVRDITSGATPGMTSEHRTYTPVGPLPPPVLVEE